MQVEDNRLTRRCIIPMFNNKTLEIDFEIIIYGRSAAELQTVPNEIVHSIAHRYPMHSSSLWALYDI